MGFKEGLPVFGLGIVLGIGIVIFISVQFADLSRMYRDGQIDCLNGEIHYELQEQENGSTQWEWIEE